MTQQRATDSLQPCKKITYGLQSVPEKTETQQSKAASAAQSGSRAEQQTHKQWCNTHSPRVNVSKLLRSNYMQLAVQWPTWRNNAQLTACNRAKITYALQSVPKKTETQQSKAASAAQSGARAKQQTHKHKKWCNTTFSTCECEYCEVNKFNSRFNGLHNATTFNW